IGPEKPRERRGIASQPSASQGPARSWRGRGWLLRAHDSQLEKFPGEAKSTLTQGEPTRVETFAPFGPTEKPKPTPRFERFMFTPGAILFVFRKNSPMTEPLPTRRPRTRSATCQQSHRRQGLASALVSSASRPSTSTKSDYPASDTDPRP